jgi:hypothetical protein
MRVQPILGPVRQLAEAPLQQALEKLRLAFTQALFTALLNALLAILLNALLATALDTLAQPAFFPFPACALRSACPWFANPPRLPQGLPVSV